MTEAWKPWKPEDAISRTAHANTVAKAEAWAAMANRVAADTGSLEAGAQAATLALYEGYRAALRRKTFRAAARLQERQGLLFPDASPLKGPR